MGRQRDFSYAGLMSEHFRRVGCALATSLFVCSAVVLSACGGSKAQTADQAYCDQVKAVGDFTQALSKVDPTDVKGSATKLTELTAKLNSIAAVAPAEIKPQWVEVAKTFTMLSSAMKKMESVDLSDPSKIDPKLIETLGQVKDNAKAMDAQGEAIDVFTKDKCGFAIGK
jgi:hypothetical protein